MKTCCSSTALILRIYDICAFDPECKASRKIYAYKKIAGSIKCKSVTLDNEDILLAAETGPLNFVYNIRMER